MKIRLLAFGLILAAFATVPAAVAAPGNDGSFFVEGKYGQANWASVDDAKQFFGISGGYRWVQNDTDAIGVEVGYADFGKVDTSVSLLYPFSRDTHAIKVGLNYQHRFGKSYLEGHAGMAQLASDTTSCVIPTNSCSSDTETKAGPYAGIGFGYWLTSHFAMSVNYDYYRTDFSSHFTHISTLSVGAEFSF